jgi:hypothetical protein
MTVQPDPIDCLNVSAAAAFVLGTVLDALAGADWYDRLILPGWVIANAGLFIAGLITGHTAWAGFNGGAAVTGAWLWWNRRRKRPRRSPSMLSVKYRHVRDAMVRTMRERSRPRPVFRPAPGRV